MVTLFFIPSRFLRPPPPHKPLILPPFSMNNTPPLFLWTPPPFFYEPHPLILISFIPKSLTEFRSFQTLVFCMVVLLCLDNNKYVCVSNILNTHIYHIFSYTQYQYNSNGYCELKSRFFRDI